MSHFFRKKFSVIMFLGCFLVVALCVPAQARTESLHLEGELSGTTTLELKEDLQLSHQELLISGTGEPGSEVAITALAQSERLNTVTTTIQADGSWQVVLPRFVGKQPTQLEISSELHPTVLERVGITVGLTTLVTSILVLVQLFSEQLTRLLQGIGLLGHRRTQGFVFDVVTKEPVAFALLTIKSVAPELSTEPAKNAAEQVPRSPQLFETVVSKTDGLFETIDLPEGRYQLEVGHPKYRFPVIQKRPWYARSTEFYQGGVIELKKQQKLDIITIPLHPIEEKPHFSSYWLNMRVVFSITSHILHILRIPMGVLSIVLTFLSPSILNFAIASLYIFVFLFDLMKNRKYHQISGTVAELGGKPVAKAVVRIIQSPPEELKAVILTDSKGGFSKRVTTGPYRLAVSKDGMIPEQGDALSFDVIDVTSDRKNLLYLMKKPESLDPNMFTEKLS